MNLHKETMNPTILVIEDERDILNLLSLYLRKEGYTVQLASDGLSGLQWARNHHPNLIILDLMLPEMDGLEVCKRLRSLPETTQVPILMLTAKTEESDKIVGLELGADDYVSKPFSPKELVARVKALLRRSKHQEAPSTSYVYSKLILDVTRHEVKIDEKEIHLTAKEFGLLTQFLKNKGRVLTRDVLLNNVWDYTTDVTTRTVDVHVRRLREKIPLLNNAIVTVQSYGYKLRDEEG